MIWTTSGDEGRRARQLERLRFWRRACADRSPDLATYGMKDGERPLVFFHGDYEAGGTYMARFAAEFGRPLASIAPHGLRDNHIPPSVEAMAAERMALVLSVCPAGPFCLGGYCNGAMVAYEVARLLVEAGHEVERVVMVEPLSLSVRPAFRALHATLAWLSGLIGGNAALRLGRAMYLVSKLSGASHLVPRQVLDLVIDRGRRFRARWRRPDAETHVNHKGAMLHKAYVDIVPAYLPPRSAFPVTVLSSGKDGVGRTCGLFDGRGWRDVCAEFTHVQLEGSHMSCLMETNDRLARLTLAALDGTAAQQWQRGPSG